jgi:hypothetical protein
VWNKDSGECVQTIQDNSGRVNAVTYDNDGNNFASCSEDKKLMWWMDISSIINKKQELNVELLYHPPVVSNVDPGGIKYQETKKNWNINNKKSPKSPKSAKKGGKSKSGGQKKNRTRSLKKT